MDVKKSRPAIRLMKEWSSHLWSRVLLQVLIEGGPTFSQTFFESPGLRGCILQSNMALGRNHLCQRQPLFTQLLSITTPRDLRTAPGRTPRAVASAR